MSATPSPEQLELLKQARAANLLKIWASGRRQLTAVEMAEIAHLLPASNDAATATTEDHQSNAVAPVPRVKYAKLLVKYEEIYGHKVRAIKCWISIGKKSTPPDPPPLDEPAQMPDWWRRHMKHRIPDSINTAAAKSRAEAASRPANAPSPFGADGLPIAPSPGAASAGPGDLSDIQTLDLRGAVEQLRRSLAVNHKLMQDSMRERFDEQGQLIPPDQGLISARQNAYKQIFDILRKAENDLVKWEEARCDLVSRSDVRAENNRISSAIFNAVLRLVKNIRPQLANKTPPEQDQIWERETLACFSSLKSSKFATPLPAPCSPPPTIPPASGGE